MKLAYAWGVSPADMRGVTLNEYRAMVEVANEVGQAWRNRQH